MFASAERVLPNGSSHFDFDFVLHLPASLLNSYVTDNKMATTRGLTKPGWNSFSSPSTQPRHTTPASSTPPKPRNPISRTRIVSPLSVQHPPRRHPPQSASTAVQHRVYVSMAGVVRAGFGCLRGSRRQRRPLWIEGKWGDARRKDHDAPSLM